MKAFDPALVPRSQDGVPNLAQVDAARNVWRSGQPQGTRAWADLKILGIRHVVKLDLETEGSDEGARSLGMDVLYVPIDYVPNNEHMKAAISAMKKPNTLVHCLHGRDRTGLVVGASRVLNDGWTKDQAWREMLAQGFHVELAGLSAWWLALRPA